jgi:hypothetical protein
MRDGDKDRLIDDIRAARRTPGPSAEEWVESERGRRVLGRVLESVDTPAPAPCARTAEGRGPRTRARSWRASRIAIAAVILVIVVIALSISLVFAGREADRPTVAQDSHTTLANPGTVELTGGVSKLSAVEHVMRLLHAGTMWLSDSVGGATTVDGASLLDEAVDRGIVTRYELSSGSAAEPFLQGQYAVLLWKAFGPYVSRTTAPTSPLPGIGDPGERTAIQGLQSAGVIRESDGAFVVDQPLDSKREQLLLDRMEDALRGQVPK